MERRGKRERMILMLGWTGISVAEDGGTEDGFSVGRFEIYV